jgi:hypothetical protein
MLTNFKKDIVKHCFKIYKKPRNMAVTGIHFLLYAYGITSLLRFDDLLLNGLLLLTVPVPMIFFIISYKFSDPNVFEKSLLAE